MKKTHPVDLLMQMVAIPSVSHNEDKLAGFMHQWLADRGVSVERVGDNVIATVKGRRPGPTFLLNSHLDTVPAKDGWESDPWEPFINDEERLVGLGSGDAKASVAAMACATVGIAKEGLDQGTLIFAATCLEEVGKGGLADVLPSLGQIDAALVGEPTSLEGAVAQSGLLLLETTAHGRTSHAARPHLGINALTIAARDVLKMDAFELERVHPFLGRSTATVTVLKGGDRHNVVPDSCGMTLDIRYTPSYTAEEITAMIGELLESEVRVRSNRLRPVETGDGAALIESLQSVRPKIELFGSPTMSDWVFMPGIEAVKIGPGDSPRSHTPNESVAVSDVLAAVELYSGCVRHRLEVGA